MSRSLQIIIYRYVLHQTEELIVCVDEPELCEEPQLLLVSKDVRAVALPIFYRETLFSCQPEAFDVVALQPWVKREQGMQPTVNLQEVGLIDKRPFWSMPSQWQQSPEGVRAEYLIDTANIRTAPPLPQPTTIFWEIDDKADWANLVEWFKLHHADKIEGHEFGDRVQAEHRVLKSVFAIIRVLRGQPWSIVLEVLKEARAA